MGDEILGHSPFFITRQEYDAVARLPAEQIAKRLGLPAEQGIRGSQLGFDVYSMKPIPDVEAKAFTSRVAPITQGEYSVAGGAQQVLVTNRTQWSDPNKNKIGEIFWRALSMDSKRLRKYADLLEQEINNNRARSKDVEWLAGYRPLLDAIEAAKRGDIFEPRELGDGLGRWMFESSIQEFKGLACRLAQFDLLLRDWPLFEEDPD